MLDVVKLILLLALSDSFKGSSLEHDWIRNEVKSEAHYTRKVLNIIEVPKCCDMDHVMDQNGCVGDKEHRFKPSVPVYEHNETHVNDEPIENVIYKVFVQNIECELGKYALMPNSDPLLSDGDNFGLFQNGSLVLIDMKLILSQTDYCLETVDIGEDNEENWITTPFVCVQSSNSERGRMVYFIVCCVARALSAICLTITTVAYMFGVKNQKMQDTYIILLSIFILAKDCISWIGQWTEIQGNICSVVGAVYHGLQVLSLVSLLYLFLETYYQIKEFDDGESRKRRHFTAIGIIAILVTKLLVIIGICYPKIVPITFVKLHPERTMCWFDESEIVNALYYCIPSFLVIVVNVVVIVVCYKGILKENSNNEPDVRWRSLKKMFFASILIFVLMVVYWIKSVFILLWTVENGLTYGIDILESLLGVFVLLLFVIPMRRRVSNNFECVAEEFCPVRLRSRYDEAVTMLEVNYDADEDVNPKRTMRDKSMNNF